MPNYSQQDIQFLKAMKQQGVPADQAFTRLQAVKTGGSQTPPAQPAPQSQNPFGAAGDWINNFGKSAGDLGVGIVNSVANSTVRPLAKGAAALATTGFKDLQGFGQAAWELPGALQKSGGDWDKQVPVGKTVDQINAEATAPVNVPFLGNVNANKADDRGNYNPYSTVGNELAIGADAGAGYINLFHPSMSVTQNALVGGVQGGAQEAQEEGANPLSVALSGGISGLTAGLTTGAMNFLGGKNFFSGEAKAPKLTATGQPELSPVNKVRAGAANIDETAVNTLQKPDIGEHTINYLDQAKQSKLDPAGSTLSPLQDVGQNHLKPAVQKVSEIQNQVGQQLSDGLNEVDDIIKTKNASQVFTDKLKDFGGSYDRTNGVSFSDVSPLANSASDQKILTDVGNKMTKYYKQGLTPSETQSLIQQIDDQISYSSKTLTPIGDKTEVVLKAVRRTLSTDLKANLSNNGRDDLVQLFSDYSKNQKALDFFNPKLGENSSSSTILKNLFSPDQKDALKPALDRIAKLTGTDVRGMAEAARTAMQIVGDERGLNLFGIITGGNNSPQGLLSKAVGAGVQHFNQPDAVAKQIVADNLKRVGQAKAASTIKELIEGAVKHNVLAPHVGKAFASFLRDY